jgi:predicted permease
MIETFFATLTPILTLFICIAVGFTIRKTNIVDRDAGKTVSKLVTWVFCPALNFITMASNFTIETLGTHGINFTLSICGVAVALIIAIPLSKVFVKENSPERGIYAYALAFANNGYMGDPLVLMILGEQAFAFYKLFTLPINMVIYSWGMAQLVPQSAKKGNFLKNLINAPLIAMLLGMAFGITGLGAYLPEFFRKSLDTLKVCMGPGAMLVAGFTIANYPIKEILTKRKVYLATLLRLTLIPAILIGIVFLVKTALSSILGIFINNNPLYLLFFASASAIGLNTVVFPEAYGGDPKTGAAMAMISHTLSVLTIPIMYALLNFVFGPAAF